MTTPPTSNPPQSQPPTPPTKPPHKKRRWPKILLLSLAALFLLILLLPTLLSTFGNSFILNKINARIKGKISADSLSIGWFSGASARNVQIKDPDGNLIVDAPTADTGLSLLNALHLNNLHLNLTLHAKTIALITYPDGTTNLSRTLANPTSPPPLSPPTPAASPISNEPTPSPSPPTKLPTLVASLDVQIDSITWTSPNSPLLTISNTSAKGSLNTSTGNTDLTLAATAQSGKGNPANLSAKLNGNFFNDGNLKPLGSLTGNADASLASLDLAALNPLLQASGLQLTLAGTADGNLKLSDTAGKQTATISGKLTQLTATGSLLEGDTFHRDSLTADVNANLTGNAAELQKCAIITQAASLNITGTVQTGAPSSANAPTANIIATVDVTALKKELPHLFASAPDTTASVNLSGRMDSTKKILEITANSTIAEKDPTTNLGNTISLPPGSILSWGTEPNKVSATIDCDWSRIQQILAAHLPTGTILAGKRTFPLHITGALAKGPGLAAFKNFEIEPTSLGFDRIFVKGLDLGKSDIGIVMKSSLLTLTPTDVPANKGTIHIAGKVDFTQDPPAYILDTNAQGTQIVTNVELNQQIAAGPLAFLPIGWGTKDGSNMQISGQLNVTLNQTFVPLDSAAFKTKGTTTGTLSILNLNTDAPIFSQLFGALGSVMKVTQLNQVISGGNIKNASFALKEGKVSYQNLSLGANAVNLTFSGSVGLDTSLAMNVDVVLAALKLPIPVGLGGTTANPKLTISDRNLGQNIGNLLQNVIPGNNNKTGGSSNPLDGLFNKKKSN